MTTEQIPGTPPKVEETIGSMLYRATMDEIMNVRVPWHLLPQASQTEVLDRIRGQIDAMVHLVVRKLATGGFEYVAASLDSFTSKKEIKVGLSLPRGVEELHTLLDRVGTSVVLVFADPKDFTGGMDQLKAQADQPALPLGED